eukprot:767289-Rhodomonas_salina.1
MADDRVAVGVFHVASTPPTAQDRVLQAHPVAVDARSSELGGAQQHVAAAHMLDVLCPVRHQRGTRN